MSAISHLLSSEVFWTVSAVGAGVIAAFACRCMSYPASIVLEQLGVVAAAVLLCAGLVAAVRF